MTTDPNLDHLTVFVRGLIVNASRGGDPMMSFSAVLKKTAPRRG